MSPKAHVSAEELSSWLGQAFPPTPQQAAVITAPAEPLLVVAGAGAGKTETMAARVVWLVANGYCTPEEVLGLTFTRKAAQELSHRIRTRLAALARCPELSTLDDTGELAHRLRTANPTVLTYDSYAGRLIREYGLLLPVEPSARLITTTELHSIARDVIADLRGDLPLADTYGLNNMVDAVLTLNGELSDHLITTTDVAEETRAFLAFAEELELTRKSKTGAPYTAAVQKILDAQHRRLALLPAVEALRARLREQQVITFAEQMSLAAQLARHRPAVRASQRRRYTAIMLDEYQDTSAAQRILLSNLFGDPHPSDDTNLEDVATGLAVTAVGDPMQAIYSWRGATASNLIEFTTDFPRIHDNTKAPSHTRQLTTSWRNPAEVLQLANTTAETQLGTPGSPSRIVEPLQPRPGAPAGTVHLGFYATCDEEHAAIADLLAERYHHATSTGETFTAAVLVRQHAQTAPIAQALSERDVAYEIVGLQGLLTVPEVQDTLAIARMLIHPHDDRAALRILLGPHIGLGLSDLKALAKRAKNLAGRVRDSRTDTPDDPATTLAEDLQDLLGNRPGHGITLPDSIEPDSPLGTFATQLLALADTSTEATVGLTDALADLGEENRYSPEGYRRLSLLASELRELRTHSLSGTLSDLISDIDQVLGLRTEVLTRENPRGRAHIGTAHLDRLAEEVANYSRIPGATLAGMLDYFDLAAEHDRGLNRGEITVTGNRVQILTVHKSKGLEWDTVVVPGVTARTYGNHGISTWATSPGLMPTSLRADADASHHFGAPTLDTVEVTNQTELGKAVDAFKQELGQQQLDEIQRLFYVALTRAEHHLIVTAARDNGAKKPDEPFDTFATLMQRYPEYVHDTTTGAGAEAGEEAGSGAEAGAGADSGAAAAAAEAAAESAVGEKPTPPIPRDFLEHRAHAIHDGAEHVRAAYQHLPDATNEGDIDSLWENEVTALIDEATRKTAPTLTIDLGVELTASDIVALNKDPIDFARRRRRPMPYKPNSYAKRGTALHAWIEQHYGATSLIDEDDLPGFEEQPHTPEELARLKETFLRSPFAEKTPRYIEHPFTVSLGGRAITGRIDAIFHDGDDPTMGWRVVDWKTGQPPTGQALENAALQLAVYRHAVVQLLQHDLGVVIEPGSIEAGFYYIAADTYISPGKLPESETLARIIDAGTHPTPTRK